MFYINTAQGWRPWVAANPVCVNSNDLQGVYRPPSRLQMMIELDERAELFCRHIEGAVNGRAADTAMFRGNSLVRPIYGAFGEKL